MKTCNTCGGAVFATTMTQPTNSIDSELEEIIGTFISLKFDVDVEEFSDGTLERWNNMLQAIKALYVSKKEVEEAIAEKIFFKAFNAELRAKLLPQSKDEVLR